MTACIRVYPFRIFYGAFWWGPGSIQYYWQVTYRKLSCNWVRNKEEDRDALRFHWKERSQIDSETFRFTRALVGLTSSPFLLGGVIQQHLKAWEQHKPELVALIRKSVLTEGSIHQNFRGRQIHLAQVDFKCTRAGGRYILSDRHTQTYSATMKIRAFLNSSHRVVNHSNEAIRTSMGQSRWYIKCLFPKAISWTNQTKSSRKKISKADVSSVSPSSERIEELWVVVVYKGV